MNCSLRRAVTIAAVGLLWFAGCSGGGPETVPVYGTVTFAGREAPKVCRLFFQPTQSGGPSRPTMAEAQPDGSYEVKAYKRSNGLVPGNYRVQISYYDLKPGANPGLDTSWIERTYDAGELVVEAGSDGIEHNIEVPKKS